MFRHVIQFEAAAGDTIRTRAPGFMRPTTSLRDPRFATTLAHGLALLCSFRVGEVALGNRQFADRTGLSKATVSRLTYTLEELGYLKFDRALRRYRLGAAALSVSQPLLAGLRVRQAARPLMQELADALGASVSLGMRDRTNMIYIETSRGHDSASFRPDIGASLPILRSAMGRAWVAQVGGVVSRPWRARIRAEDPPAWRKWRHAFDASIRRFEDRGFCRSDGDFRSEILAVGVPMHQQVDGETLVFNCGVPVSSLAGLSMDADVGPRLVAVVRAVEAAWSAAADATAAAPARPLASRGESMPGRRAPGTPERAPGAVAIDAPGARSADRDFARTLAAGMSLLSAFAEGDGPLANRDFVARTGLAKSKVTRLTYTLVALGFLRVDADSGRYRLGSPVLSMAYPLLASLQVRQVARPYLHALADEFSATVSLGVRDRTQMVYVDTSRSHATASLAADIGTARPLLGSAMGLAWLACVSAEERERACNQALIAVYRRHEAEARLCLRQARSQWLATGHVTWQEEARTVRTIAVPLRSAADGDVIVMDCSVARSAASRHRARTLARRMHRAAAEIEAALAAR